MATKRKADEKDGRSGAQKKNTGPNNDRDPKRPRKEAAKPGKADAKNAATTGSEKVAVKAPQTSVLKQEERAFPRGGASVLTPVEKKQIQIQATQDALFEESGQKVSRPDIDSDEDVAEEEVDQAAKPKTKKKGLTKGKSKGKPTDGTEEAQIRIEGLKAKRLIPGCLVLGQVSRITNQDIVLDLPNNLTGIIPLTGISALLTKKLEVLADKMEIDADNQSTDGSDDIEPKDLFYHGQYLRACVTSGGEEAEGKDASRARKKTDLSIDPRQTNTGLAAGSIAINSMVQASVVSVEDHGLIMDLGLQSGSVKGFMSSKEIPEELEYSRIREGAVFLCLVTGLSSNGNVVKLSANHKKAGDLRKSNLLNEAPTVDAYLPGTAAEVLITQVSSTGIAGQIMGLVTATADAVHSGAESRNTNVEAKYKVGSKIKARIIFSVIAGDSRRLGVSILDHVLSLSSRRPLKNDKPINPTKALAIGAVVEEAKVVNVDPAHGLYIEVGVKGIPGFVHISRVSDERVESLSQTTGGYRAGTTHRARILAYNAMDGLFLASLQKSVLEQPFLRLEDVPVGALVKCTVEKLVINAQGVGGVILNIAQGITGLVQEVHMADIHLQHPEKKFKSGVSVTARVLSVEPEKRQIRLTLKKSLVNSDAQLLSDWDDIRPGTQSVGTVVKLMPQGALLQFFGDVRGFLPVAEMSDAYIEDPTKHFRVGQVIAINVTSVTPEENRMLVSCRSSLTIDTDKLADFSKIKLGSLVSGVVGEKTADVVTIDLKGSSLKATLKIGHLTDGSDKKNASAMKQIRIGQSLQDLVVIDLFEKRQSIVVTNKPSLVKAVKDASFVTTFDGLVPGKVFHGFVRNVIAEGIFVQSVGNLTGLVHKSNIADDLQQIPDFGVSKDKSFSARILAVFHEQQRFTLTMKAAEESAPPTKSLTTASSESSEAAIDPVDGTSMLISDFTPGKLTQARIISIKDTQLNVQLANNVQGRVDISEVFSDWEQIKDRKNPLRVYRAKQTIPVRVLGVHDARNHRFLPISHRSGKVSVFELSAKSQENSSVLSFDQLKADTDYIAFVNNISENCVWVNLSPNVRGRISRMDISEDASRLNDLEENFPIGSAMQVRVKKVDTVSGRLDLSAKSLASADPLTYDDIKAGMIVTGRVTKITERAVLVQLSGSVAGVIGLTDLTDDYEDADPTVYQKNEVVRVCVLAVDKSNKRVTLTTRPSKILSSNLDVKDPLVASATQLKVNDLVRGFIKNVADVGLFIALSHNVTAFVRVAEMSDGYMKDWKSKFEIDRLVEGKIIAIDETTGRVQLSLKPSVVSKDYVPLLSFNDLEVGQVVTGKIRKVEDFGVFVVVDNSHNVSGLCHRSEIAENRIEDIKKIYSEGDAVKAKVLKVEPDKRRISFGLKASYFEDDSDASDIDSDGGVETAGMDEADDVDMSDDEDGVELSSNDLSALAKCAEGVDDSDDDDEVAADVTTASEGLEGGGFDWSGTAQDDQPAETEIASGEKASKKKKRKPEIKIDQTGDLDKNGPQTSSDFERLLLGQRNSSDLWTQYMEFQLRLSEVDEARKIAERALKEIDIREQEEKKRIWVAYLALENGFGSDEDLEKVFERACQVADQQEIHDELASIYILSGKREKADELFQAMTKKKSFTPDPKLWLNYANFLFDTMASPDRGRELLDRAMKSVPSHLHRDLVTKFAQLEFHCKNGDAERGRTIFEGLFETYPKRWDLWDVLIDLETAQGAYDQVRSLFERMSALKMKSKRAKYIFKRWLDFEEKHGDAAKVSHVKAMAQQYVEKHSASADEE